MNRLRIRTFTGNDLAYLQRWLSFEEVHKHLYTLYRPMSMEELEAWFANEQSGGGIMFFYSDGTAAGTDAGMGLIHYIHPGNRCGELSLVVNPLCFGNGYGRQILDHLMRHSFAKLELNKIFLHCVVYNARMISLVEKLKFTREGTFRSELCWRGTFYDILRYGMLRIEYDAACRQGR